MRGEGPCLQEHREFTGSDGPLGGMGSYQDKISGIGELCEGLVCDSCRLGQTNKVERRKKVEKIGIMCDSIVCLSR